MSNRSAESLIAGEARASEVARHIARCAARLFATQGYDGTPVSAIVEAAGVTKPTLYYHFGSKEGLALALLSGPIAELTERSRAILDAEADPIRGLEKLIAEHFAFSRDDPDRTRFLFAVSFGPLEPQWANALNRAGERCSSVFEEAAASLAKAGVIAPESIQSCASSIWGQVVIRTMNFLYHDQELDSELPARLVAELLWGFATAETRRKRMGDPRVERS